VKVRRTVVGREANDCLVALGAVERSRARSAALASAEPSSITVLPSPRIPRHAQPVVCSCNPAVSSLIKHLRLVEAFYGQRGGSDMKAPEIVSPQEWQATHEKLLIKEKELTRARDALAAERRRMPWMAVEKEYCFDGPSGPAGLLDLFEGRRQLIIYRFFYAPDVTTTVGGTYPERGCIGCSMLADQVAHPAHLNARNTTLAFVSRAPQAEIQNLKKRMGWDLIPWYSLTDEFDADFGVGEWHGTNVFIRDGERIFRTYLVTSRGAEALGTTWSYLDITPLGRQEEWEDSPEGYPQTPPYQWWRYHDSYG
jgi:predicted dithiol-disulfide oxidoreductase (DUF899 family)